MKNFTLLLFSLLLTSTIGTAQIILFGNDHEGAMVDDPGGNLGYQLAGGSSSVQVGTSTNTSLVIRAQHSSADLFIRTNTFSIAEGDVISVSFDISLTNPVHIVKMRLSNDDEAPFTQIDPDAGSITTTNGNVSTSNLGRIEGGTPNMEGKTTMTFTVPAGFDQGRVQIYQFGLNNTLELDNYVVSVEGTTSVKEFSVHNFTAGPNPVFNDLNLSATNTIDRIEIYSLLGQNLLTQEINMQSSKVNVSNLAQGEYLLKTFIGSESSIQKLIKL